MHSSNRQSDLGRTGGRHVLALMLAVIALGFVFAGCSEEARDEIRDAVGESGDRPGDGGDTEPPPDTTEPPPDTTEPPAETTEPPAEEPDDVEDGLSNEDVLVLVGLAVSAVVVILVATSLASSRSRKRDEARASFNRDLDQVVGGGRWVHDQGSIDVLAAADPDQLRAIWASVRSRIVDVERSVAVLAAGVQDQRLRDDVAHLGRTLADLRGVLESNVAVRLEPITGREQLVQSSNQAVYDRRPQLLAAIAPVAAARR